MRYYTQSSSKCSRVLSSRHYFLVSVTRARLHASCRVTRVCTVPADRRPRRRVAALLLLSPGWRRAARRRRCCRVSTARYIWPITCHARSNILRVLPCGNPRLAHREPRRAIPVVAHNPQLRCREPSRMFQRVREPTSSCRLKAPIAAKFSARVSSSWPNAVDVASRDIAPVCFHQCRVT